MVAPISVGSTNAARTTGTQPSPELRETFQQFVAGTFYGQFLKALRGTQGETAYLNGGQAEKMFQSQLDQQVAEDLAERQGAALAEPLMRQFQLQLGMSPAPGADTSPSAAEILATLQRK